MNNKNDWATSILKSQSNSIQADMSPLEPTKMLVSPGPSVNKNSIAESEEYDYIYKPYFISIIPI